jgi:hypothetical protein
MDLPSLIPYMKVTSFIILEVVDDRQLKNKNNPVRISLSTFSRCTLLTVVTKDCLQLKAIKTGRNQQDAFIHSINP